MPVPEMRDELIKAAMRVANRPNDHNITELIRIVFDTPVTEMPQEFHDIPSSEFRRPDSIGEAFARYVRACNNDT
jgi:hypothetical protein